MQPPRILACVIPLLLWPAGVAAQGSVTIGSGATVSGANANLFITGHWTNDGVFTPGSGTVVFNGGSNQTLIHNGTGAFNHLTVDKAGGDLVLQTDIDVNGTLTCTAGDVDLNGNDIDLDTSGTLSETAGNTIKGTSGTISATRDLDMPTSENVAGLGATLTSTADLQSTTVTRGHAVQTGAGNEGILRYYDINPTTNSGLNATLVFAYDESELNSLTESTLVLFRSTDGGSTWTGEGGTVNESANTVTLNGIDAFSRWTLGSTVTPLPVELVSFEATLDGTAVVLSWETASETNNAGFEIQHHASHGDVLWAVLAFVEGAGTTEVAQRYRFRVEELLAGRHTFRLKQIDFDGAFEYSPDVTVPVEVPGVYQLSPAYPNPFNPSTQLTLAVAREQHVRLSIFDVQGRLVTRLYEGPLAAHTTFRFVFNAASQPSGLYVIHVAGETFIDTRAVMLLK